MSTIRRLLIAAAAAGVAIVAAGPATVKPVVLSLAAAPVRAWRRVAAEAPPGRLAASQLGFLPVSPKGVTSAEPLSTFYVVDAATGIRLWQGNAVAGPKTRGGQPTWSGDFTAFTRPGRYRIETGDQRSSYPFTIAPDVYRAAIRATQRTFYFQRAFTAIEPHFAEGPWTHRTDLARAPAGEDHGWHDAGDYSLYNLTTTAALTWLLSAALDFRPTDDATNIPESGNGVPDLLDEARWGLQWLLTVQGPDGGVRNNTCLATYDRYGRNDPAVGPRYAPGEVGTMATARAVGVFALAAHVFDAVDPAFAARLREAAVGGWRFLEARPFEHSDGRTCSAYRQDGDERAGRAVRMFAAAGLWLATGEPVYREAFAQWYVPPVDPSPFRFAAFAALVYRRAAGSSSPQLAAVDSWSQQLVAETRAEASASPYGWNGRYEWGSVPYALERVAGGAIQRCLRVPVTDEACDLALTTLDYAFGRNPLQFAYVSGLPGVTHGRQHAFHHWLATLDAEPYLFPGAVAGGPNEVPPADDGSRPLGWPRPIWGYWGDPANARSASSPADWRYTDNDSWSTNELNIAWQAATLYNLLFADQLATRNAHAAPTNTADRHAR